jgi:hypothetical protein
VVVYHGLVDHLLELDYLCTHAVLDLPALLQLPLQEGALTKRAEEEGADSTHGVVEVGAGVFLELLKVSEEVAELVPQGLQVFLGEGVESRVLFIGDHDG